MFRFIGKFEFKPLSSMYPIGTPEKRRADNVRKALKNPDVRDRVLRKIHEQNFPNSDYEDYVYDLEELYYNYNYNDSDDTIADNYDFISDPDYLVEKLKKDDRFDINAILRNNEYTSYYDNNPEKTIRVLSGKNSNGIPLEVRNHLKDLQARYEDDIEELIQDEYDLFGFIMRGIENKEINLDQYDPMMDWDKTNLKDIELYLKYLSPSTLDRIQRDYYGDLKSKIDEYRNYLYENESLPVLFETRNNYDVFNLVGNYRYNPYIVRKNNLSKIPQHRLDYIRRNYPQSEETYYTADEF